MVNRLIHRVILSVSFIAAIFVFKSGFSAGNPSYSIMNFNKSQYGGANKNWSVAFDNEGYIYFGNDIGLVEFDGVSWSLYQSINGFPIRCVKYFDNRIYTGGYRELGYWERDSKGNLSYHSLTNQVEEYFLRNEEFWDISVLDGKIFFRSFSGIYIYTPDQGFDVIPADGFVSYSSVLDDTYIIAISNEGIYQVKNNEFIPILESGFFQGKTVALFNKTKETGVYLIGTESHAMYRYNADSGLAEPWANDLTNFFIRNKIDKAITGPEGDIMLGTIMNGIKIIDKSGRVKHHITVDKGLQSNTVHALAYDESGNIWMTSDKGIDFISFTSNQAYSRFVHDEMGAVYSAALFNDFLYMGTNQGLFRRNLNDPNNLFSLVPGTQRQVWDLNIIDNMLFVGHNSGTFLIDSNHTIKRISSQSGASSIALVPNRIGHLVQSTFNNLLLYKKENGIWAIYSPIAGFNDLISTVDFDHRGNLWATHPYMGIYRLRLNQKLDSVTQISYIGKDSHIWQTGNVLRVFKVDNRIVLSNQEQLYTYDDLNDSIVPYDFLNKNVGSYASSFLIVSGPSQHYWFMNTEGIALFRIHEETVNKIKEFPVSLFREDLVLRHENIVPLDERTAILCLENGYAILDASVKDAGKLITREQLILRRVNASNNAGRKTLLSPFESKITVPFARNNISLDYSFPLYSGERVKYQYKVLGLTHEWSELKERPGFTINRIPSGDYTIRVRAINDWRQTSAIHELKLTVNPPWYRSTMAFIAYALALAAFFLIGRYYVIRKTRLHEQQKWEEKERHLIQLRNEKLQQDLSFKSRQLAILALSMAKKNESLLEIKRSLRRQKDQLGTRYPDKCYNEVIKKIDINISGDDEWKIFEHNFNQAHEAFLQNLKSEFPELTPSDLRLCAFLRINLVSKEIAPLLGISVRGVENHRYRLRKKLNLSADDDLAEFILTFKSRESSERS